MRHVARALTLAVILPVAMRLPAADFIRGDANGDRAVTISDAHLLNAYLFLGRTPPECLSAGDLDDSGAVEITDTVHLLNGLFLGGVPPALPYPEAGPDPTESSPELPCPTYGNGRAVEDPQARLVIASAVAPGGNDRRATITIAFTGSKPIAGYSLRIRDGAGVVEDRDRLGRRGGLLSLAVFDLKESTEYPEGLWLSPAPDFLVGKVKDGRIEAEMLHTLTLPAELLPGEDVPLLELRVCLKPGTKAGEYPLTFEAAELVASCLPEVLSYSEGRVACPETGLPIHPTLVGGTLRVEADVAAEATCDISIPPPPEPPPPIHVLFKLTDTSGAPGSAVSVPFFVKADRPSTGFSYAIDFDEGVLEATGTRKLWQRPDGTPYEFEKFEFNNQDATPGNGGVDEGYLAGAAVISLTDTGDVLPPSREVEVLRFDLQVRLDAPAGETELVFKDGARPSGSPVNNKLIAGGSDITPSLASSFVFVNARVNIVPDVSIFLRGDANHDRSVDVSDPIHTLAFLYLGGPASACPDAADANDDGDLDIADPIVTMEVLFLGRGSLPQPAPLLGLDPTPDGLSCGR